MIVSFLAGERSNIAIKELRPLIDGLIRLARKTEIDGRPAIADGAVRERIASYYIREAGVRFTVSACSPRCRATKRRDRRSRSASSSSARSCRR